MWKSFKDKKNGIPEGLYISCRDTCSYMLTAAQFLIARIWRELRFPSTDKWIETWYSIDLSVCRSIYGSMSLIFGTTRCNLTEKYKINSKQWGKRVGWRAGERVIKSTKLWLHKNKNSVVLLKSKMARTINIMCALQWIYKQVCCFHYDQIINT